MPVKAAEGDYSSEKRADHSADETVISDDSAGEPVLSGDSAGEPFLPAIISMCLQVVVIA